MTTRDTKVKKPKSVVNEEQAGEIVESSVDEVAKAPKAKRASRSSKASLKKEKGDGNVILRIRVRAYESKILDASVKQIMDTAVRYDANIIGPVPLPTEIKKYTVNRSPFIYKNTREQFEIRVHKRLIDIVNPNPKTIESLTNLSLPSGVDIDVKMM